MLYRLWEVRRHGLHVCDTYLPFFDFVSACAASTGEFGRDSCREICRHSLKYDAQAFEKLYTEQLNNPKNTFSFGTVQHLIEVAGGRNSSNSSNSFSLLYPVCWTWDDRPHWIPKGETQNQEICYIMGFLTAASAVMSHVYFEYDGQKYYTNLFTVIQGPKGVGKGDVKKVVSCVDAIDQYVRNTSCEEVPYCVQEAGNNTDAMLIFDMYYNQGNINKGSMFMYVPELDIVSQKQSIGISTKDTRAAFHHERIEKKRLGWDSQSRKEGRKGFIIKEPRLSLLFTGTPSQIPNYFTNNTDGNLTRFLIYNLVEDDAWRSGFGKKRIKTSMYDDFCTMWGKQMEKGIETELKLTESQEELFTETFSKMKQFYVINDREFKEYTHRFIIGALRITAIIATTEVWEQGLLTDRTLTPTDAQCQRAIQFVINSVDNINKVHHHPAVAHTEKIARQVWVDMLTRVPATFSTTEFMNVAFEEGYTKHSAENALTFLRNNNYIRSPKRGTYERVQNV